jgi:DMSO reductase anchor subunit
MALLTYVPAGLLALAWVAFDARSQVLALLALLTMAAALLTLFTTGMIYASLRTIRQWHQPLTAPIYMALGVASGSVLLYALLQVWLAAAPRWAAWLAIGSTGAAGLLKWAYWRAIDGELRAYTVAAATGLGGLGKVRPLEPPHTGPNYIMREMGYRVARKHAKKLRRLAGLLAFALPMAACLLSLLPALGLVGSGLAVAAMAAGLVLERWLFFAEAEHVAMLYYGADTA